MSERPKVYVETDHNADGVRSFFEVPEALVRRFWAGSDERTFTQALADAVPGFDPYLLRDEHVEMVQRYDALSYAAMAVVDEKDARGQATGPVIERLRAALEKRSDHA